MAREFASCRICGGTFTRPAGAAWLERCRSCHHGAQHALAARGSVVADQMGQRLLAHRYAARAVAAGRKWLRAAA
jgi:hypothetical protein